MKKRLISAALAALLLVGAPASVFAGSTSGSGGESKPVPGLAPAIMVPYTQLSAAETDWAGIYSMPSNLYITPSTEKYGKYAIHWDDNTYPAATLVPFKSPLTFQLQSTIETKSYAGYGQFCSVEVRDGATVETPIVQEGKALVVLQDFDKVVLTADVNEDGSCNPTILVDDYFQGLETSRVFDFSWEENTPTVNQQMEVTNRVIDLDQLGGVYIDETISYDGPVYQATPSMDFRVANHIQGSSITLIEYEQIGTQKYKQKASYVLKQDGRWYDAESSGSYNSIGTDKVSYQFEWKASKGTLYHFEYFRPGWVWSGGDYYFQVAGEHETPIDPTEPDEPDEPEVVQPAPGPQPDGSYVVNSDTEISGFTLSMTLPADSEIAAPSATFTPVGNTPKALAAQLAADKSQLMQLVDIQLLDGGVPVTSTLQTPVDITFYSTEITASTPLTVYRSESDGSFSALGTSAQGKGYATFRTNHFSLYGLARRQLNTGRSGGGSTGFSSYWITAEAGPNGSISPAGETKVAFGDSLTVTVTPDAGYAVDKVLIDGTKQVALTDGKYTFQNVNEPYTIKATFKKASGTAETPAPDEKPEAPAAAPNPATGDIWFANLFDGLFN